MKTTSSRPFKRLAKPALGSALISAIGASCLTLFSLSASAQNLADQPLRIVTPHAAGFGFDVSLRHIAPELSKLIGQHVRIEFHPVAASQAAAAAPPTASEGATFVFAMWTARQFSYAPGVKVVYEPVSDFVPVLRINAATASGGAEAPAQYAGFIAPAGTPPVLIKQLREATFKVMAQDTLKAWTEVTGARVALIDGPGYTRFLETERVHLKPVPESKLAGSTSLRPDQ